MSNANQEDRDSWPRHGSFLAKRLILQIIGFLVDTVSTSLRNDWMTYILTTCNFNASFLPRKQLQTKKGSFKNTHYIAPWILYTVFLGQFPAASTSPRSRADCRMPISWCPKRRLCFVPATLWHRWEDTYKKMESGIRKIHVSSNVMNNRWHPRDSLSKFLDLKIRCGTQICRFPNPKTITSDKFEGPLILRRKSLVWANVNLPSFLG